MRRRTPESVAADAPPWVLRLRAEDVERFAGPDLGPDTIAVETWECEHAAAGSTLEEYWQLVRRWRARRAWRDAADAWWREHAPTDPRAPWWIRREGAAA